MKLQKQIIRSKRRKSFYRQVKRWLLGGDIDDVQLAIVLCSMLTHCLIEMKGKSRVVQLRLASELCIGWQINMLYQIVFACVSIEDARELYLKKFGDSFGISETTNTD